MSHAIFGIYSYIKSQYVPCNIIDNDNMNQRNFDKRAKSSFASRKGFLKKGQIVPNSSDF